MALDPVCGQKLHPKQSQWMLSYRGNTYHFCSDACERRFQDNPAEYMEDEVGVELIQTTPEMPALQPSRSAEMSLAA